MAETSNTITVECACGKKLKASASAVGRKAKCPNCQAILNITPPPPPASEPEDDDLGALYDLAEKEADRAAAVEQTQVICPECKRQMAQGAVLCTNCGYNVRLGKKSGIDVKKAKPQAAKAEKSGKKKDALAPEGSFVLGLAASFGFALAASLLWLGVAWGVGWDVYFLALLIGVAAGVGMQIGQKGYSTLGGFGAAGVTFVTIILAKIAVVFAILAPLANRDEAAAGDEEPDSHLVEILATQELKAKNIDPDESTDAQDEAAKKSALAKAKSMSKTDKEALIAKAEDDDVRTELKEYLAEEILKPAGDNPSDAQVKAADEKAEAKMNTMTPAQRQSELTRLEAKASAEDDAEAKKEDPGTVGGTIVHVGWLVLLFTALFGIKSAIFGIGALAIAYRTAAGSVSG